ncbi:DUF16 domain-containing protein [Mycoplasmoides pneumoniae]|uniref:UPF0134 protein MPN_100 n=9 Tax=Mycoplasmoides pneumoniae TaxID=2104 RepID=Y100_MYCPN|nr:DUF16 domain-containing protein [Mycoplasmoides pneumoniae]P75592.1 RecName: Full=UPF0134 protein MPN_100 [Mycoplasmoides pneumoniae M129]AAB95702.1 hypothetical protein MPN_100 [Mycoplasmoides pneumoniae M129]AGC04035.1 hypothetical protein C985_0102 [Mycoplasmoides pneumoniae M129-B7]ALA29979.1 hypothetical protein C897_00580 [Mycoplasmoides pneumoniae PI 1428]ALA32093.1 hypothetical protein F533_00585 [Mycoplasmoides pneumoniae 51494]ALA32795.1 hypothetical protein F530_00585 [Mycoplasm
MKEKIPFYNEKEFHDMVKKTKKGTFSGWYIIDKDNKSVEFSGSFNRQFKLNKPVIPVNTEYVTRKEFNEYKVSNDQRLTKIETTLAAQGEQINKLTQTVEKQGEQINQLVQVVLLHGEQINKLTQTVEKQGEQIKELQVEQKAQGEQIKAQGKQIKAQGKTLKSILQALGGINKRLDKIDPPK